MAKRVRIIKRYSLALKKKVVSEIEKGKLTVGEASRLYDIGGNSTISQWIKRFGKNDIVNKVVRVEIKGEMQRIKELEKEKQELESALAQERLKTLCYESLIKTAEEYYNIDLKKTLGTEASKKHIGKEKEDTSLK